MYVLARAKFGLLNRELFPLVHWLSMNEILFKHNKIKMLLISNIAYNFSDFVRGKGEPAPNIDSISCRQLLRRSVAAIFAHAGYDSKSAILLCWVIRLWLLFAPKIDTVDHMTGAVVKQKTLKCLVRF